MQQITSAHDIQRVVLAARREGKRIGVVPTMGYLHDGHASLMRAARAACDIVIATIFVNPLQFAPSEDFTRYPRDIERDRQIAEEAGCNILFTPTSEEMYPEGFKTTISVGGVSAPFEGIFRPTHFNGVATVVTKLFILTQPDKAFFGQKDYQQCLVVKKLVRDLAMPVEVVMCPTQRESDGLAMSSRNMYLSAEERSRATILYAALQAAQQFIMQGNRTRLSIEAVLRDVLLSVHDITIDYAAAADSEDLSQPDEFAPQQGIVLLVAARIGSTRLIDNLLVR
ncbi:MAG: pantoate--beta-alanine ligase [Bacteroidota bacterium]|nr:pantoate--beta-alanine ligase [Candidatus Kapabacteria bacterium]MDW8219606.1 pantoate--beta-alanine ligase [Bacteroidota bacterium]